jgi:serine/threonine-protein kinase SRPK3
MSTSSSSSSEVSSESEYIDKNKGNQNLGVILNGRYVLIEKIGYGTFSAVWLAYKFDDPTGKNFYAVKVQHQEDYEDGLKESMYLEKLKSLNCPHIIYMYESFMFVPPGSKIKTPHVCMVFDILVGSTYQLVKRGKYENGLPEVIVAKIIKQTSIALNAIKNRLGACHTDIKPENILIKGIDERIKIFQDLFLKENFHQKFKVLCEKIVYDNNFKLTNKKHKSKYSKIKVDLSKKIIKNINKSINEEIEEKYNLDQNLKFIDIDENTDIQVVLADFGTIKPFEKAKYSDDIQTRYYRAPEVIMMCGYNHKADIWSLACCAYELLTGETLFDPEKDSKYSTDFHHIFWIMELLGDIPKSLICKSKNSDEFFYSSGKFKEKKPEIHPLEKIFKEDVEIECSNKMTCLLEKMLSINPETRFDYSEIIAYIESNY